MSKHTDIQAEGIEQAIVERIAELCLHVYQKKPHSIVPFTQGLGTASVTDSMGTASAEPKQVYYGHIHGTIRMSTTDTNGDSIKIYQKNAVRFQLTGQYLSGYTGPVYMPVASPDLAFESLTCTNAAAAINTCVIFSGYKISFH